MDMYSKRKGLMITNKKEVNTVKMDLALVSTTDNVRSRTARRRPARRKRRCTWKLQWFNSVVALDGRVYIIQNI